MEVQDTIKTQFGISQLETNFNTVVNEINEMVSIGNYVLLVNGKEETSLNIHHYFDFNLSLNQRKKVAKQMYYFKKKNSLRTANLLFSLIKKFGIISDSVKVQPSKKEQDIIRKRKNYKMLQLQVEQARLQYKESKGDFYKKRLIKLGY